MPQGGPMDHLGDAHADAGSGTSEQWGRLLDLALAGPASRPAVLESNLSLRMATQRTEYNLDSESLAVNDALPSRPSNDT
eukprot:350218-Chlamydomonas_euryale.AAC.2